MMDEYLEIDLFSNSVTATVSVMGFLLLLWATIEPVYLYLLDSPVLVKPRYMVGFLTIVPSCLGMIYGSHWLQRSDISTDQYFKIKVYWLVGGISFLVFNIALMGFFPTDSIWVILNWIRWALTFGLAIGLIIGIAQARAIFSTLTAERESLRAEHVGKQRDLVDQMNGILRHEILNSVQVINGNASSLMDSNEPIEPTDKRIKRIQRHGEEIATVIQEVRSLLNTIEDDRELETTDLTSVVETEVKKIRDQYPRTDVNLRSEGDIYIQADELLGRIFANILRNAAEHNDTASLQITVNVESAAQFAVITVEDNGSGIPEYKRGTLFDRPQVNDHGLGLYLVKELTNSYDGTIDLLQTGKEGTAFEFRFPISETPP